MDSPCALVVSCTSKDPKDLIKEILGCDDLPSPVCSTEVADAFSWNINTKYYTADILLCAASNMIRIDGLPEGTSTDTVQAVVFIIDSHESNSLEKLDLWHGFIEEHAPEVRMLVCENFSHPEGTGISRQAAHEWCLNHSFELVELVVEQLSDTEDDFPETTGVPRIIQALHAHMWTNMVLKDNLGFPAGQNLLAGEEKADVLNQAMAAVQVSEDQAESMEPNKSGDCSGNSIDDMESLMMSDLKLYEILGEEDPANLPFECLFEKLRRMKQLAKDMPAEQRKVYAEKVAVAFWRAMGGDEDEILGLSSDIEDDTDDTK